jgi:hypothetical protein
MSLAVTLGLNCVAFAQSSLAPVTPEICDVNLALLKSANLNSDPNIITADTVSPKGTTIPSLWWTSEQFPSKLVTNWVANRNQKQIYLLVNSQYWNILDYIDRYRTVDRFGRVAQSYGYDLKICSNQKIALARYTCNSLRQESSNTPPQNIDKVISQNTCQIWLNVNGQDGLGVQTK